MEKTPILTIAAIALLAAPALAGGVAASDGADENIWTLEGRTTHVPPTGEGGYGWSIAMSDGTAFIGAPNAGEVQVVQNVEDAWVPVDTLTGPADFGRHLAAHGDHLLVSSPPTSTVFAYERTGTGWSQQAALDVPYSYTYDLALDNGTALVGIPGLNKVHVYEHDDSEWQRTGEISGDDQLGNAVAIDGDDLFVLAPPSSVEHYRKTDGTWPHQATLQGSFPFDSDLDLDEDTLVAGSPLVNAATVYERSGNDWQESQTLGPDDGLEDEFSEWFGRSVDAEGDRIAVSASEEDPSPSSDTWPGDPWECPPNSIPADCPAPTPGAVYLFHREGDGWIQEAKITSSDAGTTDDFGVGLALAEDEETIIAGAPMNRNSGFLTTIDAEDAAYVYTPTSTSGLLEDV